MDKRQNNPYLRHPDHPNYNRRACHHDYRRPAGYLLTFLRNPSIPAFSQIVGDISLTEGENAPHPVLSRAGSLKMDALKLWLEKIQADRAERVCHYAGSYPYMPICKCLPSERPQHRRKWTEAESDEYQEACKANIDNGGVPVSPFIHPKEKDIRDYARLVELHDSGSAGFLRQG